MKKPFLKKTVLIALMILLILLNYVPTISSDETGLGSGTFSTTLYVGGTGPGNYSTIQSAINDASNGDTVYVYNGTYNEQINVNNQINLFGENKYDTIIDGNNQNNDGFNIYTENVSIHGFTITNHNSGIEFSNQKNIIIVNNIIQNNDDGICFQSSYNITILNNTFLSNGIIIYGNLNQLTSYTIENNTANGKPIRYYKNSQDIIVPLDTGQLLICNCTNVQIQYLNISDTDVAIEFFYCSNIQITDNILFDNHWGIIARDSSNVNISLNNIHDNERGIFTHTINNSIISMNQFSYNTYGIEYDGDLMNYINYIQFNRFTDNEIGIVIAFSIGDLYVNHNLIESSIYAGIVLDFYSSEIFITENIIINGYKGIVSITCLYNYIYHNTFINKNQNARDDDDLNNWDNDYPSGGNYWSDYTGTDANNDGIGDTLYNIPNAGNADYYPLMHPYGLLCDVSSYWNFLSIPMNHTLHPSDILILYNDTFYSYQQGIDKGIISPFFFSWNQNLQSYQFDTQFIPGKGYWIFAYKPCSFWTFSFERNINTIITALEPKWNMMSAPYDFPIDKNQVIITSNNTEYTWSEAVTNHIISDTVFGWDAQNQTYLFASSFEPGKCYWMFAFNECTLKDKTP